LSGSSLTTRRQTTRGVTFLVREEGTGHLVLVVVGDDGEPTPVTQDVMDGWDYQFE